MAEHAPGPSRRQRGSWAISRLLVAGFATIAIAAAALSAALVAMVSRVNESLDDVRKDARSTQMALTIALETREHYRHEAHAIIHGRTADVEAHDEWVPRLQDRARQLAARVPSGERWHLERLSDNVAELDAVFRTEVIPAATTGDHERLARAHARAEEITEAVTGDADAVAASLERRMRDSRQRAREAAELAVTAGAGGVALIVLLAAAFAVGLRRTILSPLRRLAEAAHRIGRGEAASASDVGGRGEIATVARAFEEMTDRLRERERQLVESERMAVVGQLAAVVAHEINNPIAVIRGYLRTMVPEAGDEELRSELEILDEEATACQRIVEDLLSFARAPHLQRSSLDAEELLQSAARRFRATQEGRRHPVDVSAEPGEIEVDAVRIRQVLDNLLRNATQASAADSVVSLHGRPTAEGYRIEVVDRGSGIPEEDRERIFEPFRTSRAAGSGLGLAVCKAITEAHGGTIRAEPAEGGGSCIALDLPARSGAAEEDG